MKIIDYLMQDKQRVINFITAICRYDENNCNKCPFENTPQHETDKIYWERFCERKGMCIFAHNLMRYDEAKNKEELNIENLLNLEVPENGKI